MTINIYNVPQDQDLCDTPDKPGATPDWTGSREQFMADNAEDPYGDLLAPVAAMEAGDSFYYGGGATPLIWIEAVSA